MLRNLLKKSAILTFGLFIILTTNGQETQNEVSINNDQSETSFKLNVGADIMSRYVWRGTDFGDSPAIQPTISFSNSFFEIGCWSSVATNSFYKEVDLYAKYTYKSLSFIFTDYFIPSLNGTPSAPDTRYFTYNDDSTAHTFEASLLYKRSEKLPFWLMANVFLYGNDKRWGFDAQMDTDNETYYSTYLEAGYTFTVRENNIDLFAGFTPYAGAYGNTTGFVNLGLTGYRKIRITDHYELPVKASLICNPQASSVFATFGITL
jgi:hypothetical protein